MNTDIALSVRLSDDITLDITHGDFRSGPRLALSDAMRRANADAINDAGGVIGWGRVYAAVCEAFDLRSPSIDLRPGAPRYTVRPLGCAAWANCRTLREARKAARAACAAGLARVVIVDERTGATCA